MLGRMLNSMDNIERHLAAICVGDGDDALLELPAVQQTSVKSSSVNASPVKDNSVQEAKPVQEETIESLSSRVSMNIRRI